MGLADAAQHVNSAWGFEDLLAHVLNNGERRSDRTGTGTLSVFAPPALQYSLADGKVPLITSKAVPWKMALREFMWMLSGSTNTDDLRKSSPAMANLWDLWATDGDVGPTYGAQYRNAGGSLFALPNPESFGLTDYGRYADERVPAGVDQLREVVVRLAESPDTRRALISLWSVPELRDMALEPCMVLFQFSLRGPNYDRLEVHIYQRSADLMLGVPFDLFQGGFLAHAIARELSLLQKRPIQAVRLTWSAGDTHIYLNQLDAARIQLSQAHTAEPMRAKVVIDRFPSLRLLDGSLEPGHVTVTDYNPAPAIDAGKPAV
ncbi:thymidylate synthase [Microbacterium phage Franklin22]|uniref:thymidylate synthase n=1 Tax=Microbacterium phage Franklin22 TaxID=2894293 RepID=UPI001E720DB8|nr:thymidylate synthase [Microbacterium phage Franklin22]UGL61874.1 thymidylate synthase [Microbacterium phage Franklin22]